MPLQPAYSESGEIKGGNNIVEGCQRECEYESSSNIETEFWGSEAGSDSSFINSTVKLLLLAVCEQYCGQNSRSSLHIKTVLCKTVLLESNKKVLLYLLSFTVLYLLFGYTNSKITAISYEFKDSS